MKKLIYLFVFTALVGCQKSPDEIIIEDFQTYFNNEILQNMDDPKSYEIISTTD